MKLKLDEKGAVVLQDGKPVYVAADGKEVAYDVPKLVSDLERVNGESAGRRKELESLETKLKVFDGLDPEEARKALELAKNLKDGDLIKADKAKELEAQLKRSIEDAYSAKEKGYAEKISGLEQSLADKDASFRRLLIKSDFGTSKFLAEKTFLTPDIAYDFLGKSFDIEEQDGEPRVVAKLNGQPIFSRANPSRFATTDEAIEVLIEHYPLKDRILKSAPGGAGSPPNNSGGGGAQGSEGLSSTQKIAAGLKAMQR